MFVPLSESVHAWLLGRLPFRNLTLRLPNYPIETLAIVTPANDNRETVDPLRAIINVQKTHRQLGLLPHGITHPAP